MWMDGRTRVWIALAGLLVVVGAYLLYITRGTTLWFDEWEWVAERRGGGVGTFLEPHNGHFSLVPVAIYKALFATVGLAHSAPYRVVVIAGHLTCVLLLFVYASRRVGGFAALVVGALLLLLGPAWQNILWPFQIGSLASLAAGLAMLLALDRADRRGDVAACVLLAVSLASSGLGLVFAAGAIVDVGWARRRWRDAWIVVAPLVLYGAWWLAYRDQQLYAANVFRIPGFVADSAAASLSALAGLTGVGVEDHGMTLGWGRPLAAAAAALLVWSLARRRRLTPRVLTLLVMPLAFWVLAALTRAQISTPLESRYLYVGGLLVLLLAVELARGVAVPHGTAVLLGAAAAVAVVANVGDLRAGGRFLRDQSLITRVDLGAVQLAGATAPPDAQIAGLPGYPLVVITVGQFRQAARQIGSPAATPAEIAGAPEGARLVADAELARLEGVRLVSAPRANAVGAAPHVDASAGGTVTRSGGCVHFAPTGVAPGRAAAQVQLTVPGSGLRLVTRGGTATVAVRRFADGFPADPLGTLGGSASAALRARRDAASTPWHVRVTPEAHVVACGV